MKKADAPKLNDVQINNLAKEKVTLYICGYGKEVAHRLIQAMAKIVREQNDKPKTS